MRENTHVKKGKTLVDRIQDAAKSSGVVLPEGWKAETSTRVVVQWSTTKPSEFPKDLLDRASKLFHEIKARFDILKQPPASTVKF